MNNRNKNVILYLTDFLNDEVIKRYLILKEQINKYYDVIILYHKHDDVEIPKEIYKYDYFIFSDDDIFNKLGYIPFKDNNFIPGNAHLPIFYFMKHYYKKYKYYWRIENDVYYNGDWLMFINDIPDEYDYVASHIELLSNKNKKWNHFNSPYNILPDNIIKIKSFAPILRLSYDTFECLDLLFKKYTGHFELTIPSFLYTNGFKLGDFGGEGGFVIPNMNNKYYNKYYEIDDNGVNFSYINYTLRFRPLFKSNIFLENKIYHPVKIIKKI